MAPPLLILRDIRLTFGGTPLLEAVDVSVSAGDRLCLVGRNGSGKSTVLKLAAGLIEPDAGERVLRSGTTVRYLAQEPELTGAATTLDYVTAGLAPGDDRYRASYLLEQLDLTGGEDPARLSGGEARRCALARALAPAPDILLLDEPTNHLDLPSIEWLEDELRNSRAALVLVSHDRRFLENLSTTTIWLAQGQSRELRQGFAAFEAWRDSTLETEERDRQKRDRKIASETEWLHKGVTARRKRNQGRLRALYALREKKRQERRPVGNVEMAASEAAASGRLVIEALGVSKAFGDNEVIRNYSVRVQRGDRIGMVGPNGAGKTTLLNILTGVAPPDEGQVRLGTNLEMATLDQLRESLDPTVSLGEALVGGPGDLVSVGGQTKHVTAYMKEFLFSPEQLRTPVGALSGGERGRIMLARALARPSNLLILDEPTNDLDLETLDLLQEMLADYRGTILLVSHDRDFLDRVVSSVIMSEGGGSWTEYAGGYSDMISQQGSGIEATSAPTRKSRPGNKPATRTLQSTPSERLSFKDKYALETLPARIEALAVEISGLKKKLADPELYRKDPEAFEAAAQELRQAEAGLTDAEEEWLALEIKREAAEKAYTNRRNS